VSSVVSLLHSLRFLFRSRASLHLEIIGLRHQRSYRTPSHWQNAYVERVIGSIQRVRLDRVIVLNATGLHWILRDYIAYYMRARTDLAGQGHAVPARPVTRPSVGRIVASAEVGGLHHRTTASPRSHSAAPIPATPDRTTRPFNGSL
jgi:hypothetical protein